MEESDQGPCGVPRRVGSTATADSEATRLARPGPQRQTFCELSPWGCHSIGHSGEALSPRGLHPLPVIGHLCSPVSLEVKGATGLLSGVVRKIQQDVVLTIRTLTC